MSEFCKAGVCSISLFFSYFKLLCFFIFSHPIYFSYFIFFSPYILRIFSFLSPLFITTNLLCLTLFTFSVHGSPSLPLLLWAKSDGQEGEDAYGSVEIEVYKTVFEIPTLEIIKEEDLSSNLLDELIDQPEIIKHITEEKTTEEVLKEEKITEELLKEEKESSPPKAEEGKCDFREEKTIEEFLKEEKITEESLSKKEKEASPPIITVEEKCDLAEDYDKISVRDEDNNYYNNDNGVGGFDSMRKEKEWKRTLACKLFEERHSGVDQGENGEGMDLLWETFETKDDFKVHELSSTKSKMEKKENEMKNKSKSKKGGILDQWPEEEEEEDEEETDNAQLCCLQALKLSSGKMHLGLGRPNLVKITKALKGIGWLHHVTTKHARKGNK